MTTPNPARGCWCEWNEPEIGEGDEACDCCLRAAEKVRDAILRAVSAIKFPTEWDEAHEALEEARETVRAFDRGSLAEIIAEGEK